MRSLAVVVGTCLVGCAAARPPTTDRAQRLAWLRAQTAQAGQLARLFGDGEAARGSAHDRAVCSVAIAIAPWYGVTDEHWELSHAGSAIANAQARNMREDLVRLGVRNCVLDPTRD